MTEREIRINIIEIAVLNDLLSTRIGNLKEEPIRHKNMEKSFNRSFKAANGLSTVMDNKLGLDRAEAFGDMYEEADKIIKEISSHFIK